MENKQTMTETQTILKPQDLRIGNWVYFTDFPVLNKPVQVDIKNVLEEILEHQPSWFFKPIPLTPEMLGKAGFEKWDNGEYFTRVDEYISLHIYEDGRYVFWSGSADDESSFTVIGKDNRIQYLHQLQNLFFSLTGKELKVNL